jgi:hypothetical protein
MCSGVAGLEHEPGPLAPQRGQRGLAASGRLDVAEHDAPRRRPVHSESIRTAYSSSFAIAVFLHLSALIRR